MVCSVVRILGRYSRYVVICSTTNICSAGLNLGWIMVFVCFMGFFTFSKQMSEQWFKIVHECLLFNSFMFFKGVSMNYLEIEHV